MSQQKYSMSFTTGNLFQRESVQLAQLYLELNDWRAVRATVLSQNLLQARTESTARRLYNEIVSRLKTLSNIELTYLLRASGQEVGYLLWLAVCRRYQFIAEFAVEVLRERYLTLKIDLPPAEFESFFDRKAEWHSELERIRPSTRIKLRQVVFHILREAGLLTRDNTILAAMLSTELVSVIEQEDHRDLFCFPIFEPDPRRAEK